MIDLKGWKAHRRWAQSGIEGTQKVGSVRDGRHTEVVAHPGEEGTQKLGSVRDGRHTEEGLTPAWR